MAQSLGINWTSGAGVGFPACPYCDSESHWSSAPEGCLTHNSPNRWAAFTDDEMHRLGQDVRGDCDLTLDIDAECKRRGIDTR